VAYSQPSSRYLDRPSPSGLADVIDLILDKGLVIDIYVRVSLVGIELLTIDARIVVASVDTYLRFAEAVNRLDLRQSDESESVPDLMEGAVSGASKSKTKGMLEGAKESFTGAFSGDDEDEEVVEEEEQPVRAKRRTRKPAGGSKPTERRRERAGDES
jgi:gas vesicle structural protein